MGGRGGARPRKGGHSDGAAWGAARRGRRASRVAAVGAGEQRGAGPGCTGAGRACIGRGRGVATAGRGAGSGASGARAAAVAAVTERGREGKRKRGRGPHYGAVGTGKRGSGRRTGTSGDEGRSGDGAARSRAIGRLRARWRDDGDVGVVVTTTSGGSATTASGGEMGSAGAAPIQIGQGERRGSEAEGVGV
nr:spidroin-1-like [Aegilops tauschii subsp. strangulata]